MLLELDDEELINYCKNTYSLISVIYDLTIRVNKEDKISAAQKKLTELESLHMQKLEHEENQIKYSHSNCKTNIIENICFN